MLKIYEEQMARLSSLRRDAFAERMRPLLRRSYPERTAEMSDADLDRAIGAGNDAASRHGVTREGDIERYIYLQFALGAEPVTVSVLPSCVCFSDSSSSGATGAAAGSVRAPQVVIA